MAIESCTLTTCAQFIIRTVVVCSTCVQLYGYVPDMNTRGTFKHAACVQLDYVLLLYEGRLIKKTNVKLGREGQNIALG